MSILCIKKVYEKTKRRFESWISDVQCVTKDCPIGSQAAVQWLITKCMVSLIALFVILNTPKYLKISGGAMTPSYQVTKYHDSIRCSLALTSLLAIIAVCFMFFLFLSLCFQSLRDEGVELSDYSQTFSDQCSVLTSHTLCTQAAAREISRHAKDLNDKQVSFLLFRGRTNTRPGHVR